MKAKRKVYVTGGVVPKKKPATKPAAKTAGAAKKQLPPLTEGERLGMALKKGDYAGAARQVGEAVAGVPKELYGALRRSLR